MLASLIHFSIRNKLIIFLFTLSWVGFGIYALFNLSIGAVPDITNNQVQILTTSRNLSTEDVEKFLTYPIELEMANLPGVEEIRSISKFGLSVVTVVFEDAMGTYLPRQLIAEKLPSIAANIPDGYGSPSMGPVSTGLGEIYQYIIDVHPDYQDRYSVSDLRSIQDWIVKRQLAGISGVVEVNTWGGYLKTYEVAVAPEQLRAMNITLPQIYSALKSNNSIAGGSYIEKTNESYFIRGEGLLTSLDDIRSIVVDNRDGYPIYIKDLAQVEFSYANRFGAITGNGEGEKVLGQIMMLKDASALDVISSVKKRMQEIEKTLPEGIIINPFLERSDLISRTTFTIAENLILGCLIVIFIVVLLLGSIRSGLVIASVIPLCLLFAISMMYMMGIDANLMSMGAIDFGIIIDGAVIIVEYTAFKISHAASQFKTTGGSERQTLMDKITYEASTKMMRSAIFGQLIIIIVFIPILTLTGIEGKMFRPMALTFCFALLGAMILCFTYVPAMSALFIRPMKSNKPTISSRLLDAIKRVYTPLLEKALAWRYLMLVFASVLLVAAGFLFNRMGSEFVPTLDEGDFAIQPVFKVGMSLSKTIELTTHMEQIISRIPEVKQVVSRIGAAEVPTDPMSMEQVDIIVTFHPPNTWTSADSKDGLADILKEAIETEIPNVALEFTQPIEMRFNELISGVKSDLGIKIYGDDLDILQMKAEEIKSAISNIEGAADITSEKTAGLPQMIIKYNRQAIAKYGINIADLNQVVTTAFAGQNAGIIYEGEQQYDIVLKYQQQYRQDLDDIKHAMIPIPSGEQLPLSAFADIAYSTGPAMISRDDTRRRTVVGVNVRGRDLQSVVDDIQQAIQANIKLPPGYAITYGGQFENLKSARQRLLIAVPISLLLIFVLLFFAFGSLKETLIVYTAIPLAAIGGVLLLYLRDIPFSISAGVGFIALFGIAVLNGIVLIEHYKELQAQGITDIRQCVVTGTTDRLRPILLTASAAALGFLPMAISTSAGAEVQRPLATVVIGGLITASFLTLFILPILYSLMEKSSFSKMKKMSSLIVMMMMLLPGFSIAQQDPLLETLIDRAYENSLQLQADILKSQQATIHIQGSKVIDKTNFYYNYDHNNLPEIGPPLHVLGVQQSFKLPGYYKALEDMTTSQQLLHDHTIAIDKRYIAKEVSLLYTAVLYYNSMISEYSYIDSIYQQFLAAAKRKFELGSSSAMEKVTAEAKRNEIKLKHIEHMQQRALLVLQLSQWTRDSVALQIPHLIVPYEIPSELVDTYPTIAYHQQLVEIAKAAKILEAKKQIPDLNIGLFNGFNSFSDFKLYPGIEAGIAVPIWNKAYKSRIAAADLEIAIRSKQLEQMQYLTESRKAQLATELLTYRASMDAYTDTGNIIQQDLISSGMRSWEGGEIDVFQLIQTLESAGRMRLTYLDQVYRFNITIINLQYLQN